MIDWYTVSCIAYQSFLNFACFKSWSQSAIFIFLRDTKVVWPFLTKNEEDASSITTLSLLIRSVFLGCSGASCLWCHFPSSPLSCTCFYAIRGPWLYVLIKVLCFFQFSSLSSFYAIVSQLSTYCKLHWVSPLSTASVFHYFTSYRKRRALFSNARQFLYVTLRQTHGFFDVARFFMFGISNENDCSLPEMKALLSDFSRFIHFACCFASVYPRIF